MSGTRISRETIWFERSGLGNVCRTKNRAVILDNAVDPWIVQLEHKTGGPGCSVGCDGTGVYHCGVEVRLDLVVPDNVDVEMVCDPASSSFRPEAWDGPPPTLPFPRDGSEPVMCSATPEAAT